MSNHVPVVDLAAADAASVAEIAGACRHWGFFQIVGHGIPPALVKRFEAAMHDFFALPTEAKRGVRRSRDNARGYYEKELTKNVQDWKEIFDFGFLPRPDLPDEHPSNRTLDGQNRWPAELPGFRETAWEFYAACEAVALRLLEPLCRGLDAAPDALRPHFEGVHTSFLRLNHYPPCVDPAPPDAPLRPVRGHLGVNRHTDAGALTVLFQDARGGLQVHRDGRFHDVEPIEGALVVNVGDMMQVWSNDRYRAPLHRVVTSADQHRYSAPFFLNPAYESDCAPLAGRVDAARYRPVNWGEFRRRRAAGDYADLGEEVQVEQYRIAPPRSA